MILNRSGMAMVVVLGVISVLLVTGLHLAGITRKSVTASIFETDRFEAKQMAIAGIHLVMLMLTDDAARNDTDSVQEAWADPEKLAEAVGQLGYDRGGLTLTITDELGKIQVNALLRQFPGNELNPDQAILWERFLTLTMPEYRTLDYPGPEAVINALKDWLDSGDDGAVSGLSGAETAYYGGLDSPYACADGPFNTLAEIWNVKGIGLDIFQGVGLERRQDLRNLVTVYGLSDIPAGPGTFRWPGRININTAGIEVLRALFHPGLMDAAQDLLDYRDEKSEDGQTFVNLLDKGWYTRVIELPQSEKQFFDRMVRYDSHLFRVDAAARLNQASVNLSAVIKRKRLEKSGQWTCRIIQMERM
jgi:general secretion pathway protein K